MTSKALIRFCGYLRNIWHESSPSEQDALRTTHARLNCLHEKLFGFDVFGNPSQEN